MPCRIPLNALQTSPQKYKAIEQFIENNCSIINSKDRHRHHLAKRRVTSLHHHGIAGWRGSRYTARVRKEKHTRTKKEGGIYAEHRTASMSLKEVVANLCYIVTWVYQCVCRNRRSKGKILGRTRSTQNTNGNRIRYRVTTQIVISKDSRSHRR